MGQPLYLDCAIVGAGPAGLTAAIYLRRFHRNIVVLDAGQSRARWIPESHNCPGFPRGVSGDEFLQRLREQADTHEVPIARARVTGLQHQADCFLLSDEAGQEWQARNVLIATGVIDVLPEYPWVAEAVAAGAMRLCAICDGFEASDGSIGVYGPLSSALKHGLFMRTFSPQVKVLASDGNAPDNEQAAAAEDGGIEFLRGVAALDFDGKHCQVTDGQGNRHVFDALYPVLGGQAQSALALGLGAALDEQGEIITAPDQQTSVEGLYAIGDVVSALNQISVAVGHAALAATAIHNRLPRNYR